MANNNNKSATKVVMPCRISFANIWEPKSINGSEEKYSVSCIIPKTDKATLLKIFENVAYIMALHADPSTPASIDEWLDQFEMFSIYEVLPEILELWGSNLFTDVKSAKN